MTKYSKYHYKTLFCEKKIDGELCSSRLLKDTVDLRSWYERSALLLTKDRLCVAASDFYTSVLAAMI